VTQRRSGAVRQTRGAGALRYAAPEWRDLGEHAGPGHVGVWQRSDPHENLLAAPAALGHNAHMSDQCSYELMNTVISPLGKVKKSCKYEIWALK